MKVTFTHEFDIEVATTADDLIHYDGHPPATDTLPDDIAELFIAYGAAEPK